MWKSLYANFKQTCWCPLANFARKAFALSGLEKKSERIFWVSFYFKERSPEEKKSICPCQACPLLGDVPSVTTREQYCFFSSPGGPEGGGPALGESLSC